MGVSWERCPSSYLRTPEIHYALDLYSASKIAPLSDWPDGWACWVKEYLCAIDNAIKERQSKDFERLSRE